MNTTKRKRVAVVAGKVAHPRSLLLFDGLARDYDVTIYAINTPAFASTRELTSRVLLFDESADMPGYLRGVETMLADASLVIGLETSRLSTFQAIRAAARHGIPSAVLVNEFIPYFYSSYPNIRAVQSDIVQKTDRFLATSSYAVAALEIEGAPARKIGRVTMPVATRRFRPNAESRQRFRDYIHIRPEERLVMFHGDLIPENQPERLLQAARMMRQMAPGRTPPMRLLFVGNGPHADSLKYQAHDMGLGQLIMFMHQDPSPFLHDLYAATDAVIHPEVKRTDIHEEIPWHVLEAMASGAAAIVVRNTIAGELAGGGAIQIETGMPQSFAQALLGITSSDEALARAKGAACEWIRTRLDAPSAGALLSEEIAALLASPSAADLRMAAFTKGRAAIEDALLENNPHDALVHVEDLLLIDSPSPADRSEVLRMKGDTMRALGKSEEAMEAYGKAIQDNPSNAAAHRGLGVMALHGHSHEEALTFFRRALAANATDAQAMFGIGMVHRRIGLADDALLWFEKAITADPTYTTAITTLTQTCVEAKNPRRAEEILERVMDVTGETSQVLMALGRVYLAQGKSDIGNRTLQRALQSSQAG